MAKAPETSTKPEAGVIPTNPEIAPEAIPISVGFFTINHSMVNQINAPAVAAMLVTNKAFAAMPSAAN
ncbi:MAG: Uncharacterised protein [Rhodothermaeota bacterium MED-G12]|nr:MAG: Uncharacterised protein [Rhodothermaeota bacterium MED-G12]